MNICGIELKANNVILIVLEDGNYIDIKIKKLIIKRHPTRLIHHFLDVSSNEKKPF